MNFDIPAFEKARVLVAGDVMLDRYWSGPTSRISPEAPVPVVQINAVDEKPGGAGNVALNIAALGAHSTLLAIVGNDNVAEELTDLLTRDGVQCELLKDNSFSTITKLRVLSQHQQLIRLDFEQNMSPDIRLFNEHFDELVGQYDVVVLSDYGKGALADIGGLIDTCQSAGRRVIVDPKGNDFSRYRGASIITPNLSEFQAVVGRCLNEDELQQKASYLLKEIDIEAVLITRGEEGMSLITAEGDALHIPTEAREVFDVTGAGDTVIAMLSTALACDLPLLDAVRLSNIAAGVTVAKLGSATVSVSELKRAWHGQRGGHGMLSEAELLAAVTQARNNGETVVMTNGCFDILHAGHVQYLGQAAALGDRLIVAVNVDETVRALKGEERPVNALESRMAVLAGLAAVDWVVAFSEETPERLICAVKPDFLVKGGDNDPDKVPGAACVREAGGEVLALDYLEGKSTTHIISKIKNH